VTALARAAALLLSIALAPGLAGCADAPAVDPRPRAPYAVFEGTTFEPSAVVYDAAADRVLVCSDKDGILYRYRLEGGRLELPRDERHRAFRFDDGRAIMKVEAMTPLASGAVLATTSFDREDPDFRRLVVFRFQKKGAIETKEIPFDAATLTARLRAVDPGIDWWKVEGLAVTKGDGAALLAVRSVGKTHKKKRDVIWIARCPRTGADIEGGVGAPDLLIRLEAGAGERAEGCSSLERDPADGSYLLLTSWEDEDLDSTTTAHGAHLYRLPAAMLEGPAAPSGKDPAPATLPSALRTLAAKAEGLALLPGGRALVVFDDDQGFKKLFQAYEQHEGAFVILEAADLKPPPR